MGKRVKGEQGKGQSKNFARLVRLFPSSPFSLFPYFPIPLLISGTPLEESARERISAMFKRIISTSSSWVTIPIRLALAAIFFAHGAGKVFGSFGGPGLNNFINSGPAPFSFMRPAWLWWGAAAVSELLGAILVFLGLLTRVGAFLLACVMLTAITVHWPAGFIAKGGYEYPLALFSMSLALLIAGGGMASIDRNLSSGRRR